MKSIVKIAKLDTNYIELELVGEDHTIANLITKYAIEDPHVKYSAYNIEHPLISHPKIVIRTEGREAITVLNEILKKILNDVQQLAEKISTSINEVKKG